jgi:putative SOS response-associated peptidase YedK
MCGRFAFYSPSEATAALFGVASTTHSFQPRYNIAPSLPLAAVRQDDSQDPELVALRWGLVPFWAKDPSIGNRMINARAETVAEKPSFRTAYRKRRCLILADGFYEWHKTGDSKIPYYICMPDGQPFAFAGLWEDWLDKESGESLQTTAIITTAANDFMSSLHHRMPVVVRPDAAADWLAGNAKSLDDAIADAPAFTAWPVDRMVNSTRNQGPELIVSVGDKLQA